MSLLARLFAGCLVVGTLTLFLAGVAGFSLYRFSETGSDRGSWSLPLDGASSLVASVEVDSGDVTIANSLPAGPPVAAGTAVETEYLTGEDAPIDLTGYTANRTAFTTVGSDPAEPPIAILRWLRSPVQATWDIGLSPAVPVDLTVTIAVGSARVDLTGLTMSRFDITLGVGDADVILGNEFRPEGINRILVGAGDVNIVVPEDLPVSIELTAGFNGVYVSEGFAFDGRTYTNAAWQARTNPNDGIEIVVETGTSDISVTELVTDDPRPETLDPNDRPAG